MKVLNILKVLDFIFSFSLLLLLGGDIETNPGPFPSLPSLPSFDKKEDPVALLQIVVDDQADKILRRPHRTKAGRCDLLG